MGSSGRGAGGDVHDTNAKGGCGDYLVVPINANDDAVSALSIGYNEKTNADWLRATTTTTTTTAATTTTTDTVIDASLLEHYANKDNNDDTGGVYMPDIIAAYKRSLMQQACPSAVLVPDVPGALLQLDPELTVHYLVFDECVLGTMARLGWNRSHGVVKLMPMACALYEHWKADRDGILCYETL